MHLFMNDPAWLNYLEREISLLKTGLADATCLESLPEGGAPIEMS